MENHASDQTELNEILRLVEESALHDFPNPERVGCPPEDILEAFARDPRSFPIKGPEFQHLLHCSPCFRFIQARRARPT